MMQAHNGGLGLLRSKFTGQGLGQLAISGWVWLVLGAASSFGQASPWRPPPGESLRPASEAANPLRPAEWQSPAESPPANPQRPQVGGDEPPVLRRDSQFPVAEAAPAPARIATGPVKPRVEKRPEHVARRTGEAPVPGATGAGSATETISDATPTVEQINAAIKALEAGEIKDEAAKKQALEQFQQALKSLEQAAEAEKKTAEWKSELERAPELIQDAKTQLAEAPEEPQPDAAEGATVAQLEPALSQAEDDWQEAKKALAEAEQAQNAKARAERKEDLAKRKAKAKDQLEEVEKELGDLPRETPLSRRVELQCRRRQLKSQIVAYEAERARWDALVELFPLERDLAQRRIEAAEKLTLAWRALIAKRRSEESERQAADARRLAGQAHPKLRELAEKNVKLAERYSALDRQLRQVAAYREELEKQRADLDASFKNVSGKVKRAGMSPTVGLLMRTQRDHLPDQRFYRQRLRYVEGEMQHAQLELMDLESDRAALSTLDQQLERVVADLETRGEIPFQPGYLRAMTRELREQRRGFLDKLLLDNNKYFDQLSDLGSETREFLNTIDQYTDFIDQHILWIRSNAPLRLADFSAAGRAAQDWLRPTHWWQVVREISVTAFQFPLSGLLLASVSLLGFLSLTPIQARISALGGRTASTPGEQFLATLKAFFWTALAALFWPAVLASAGWWLTWGDQASDLTLEVAHALQALAPSLYAVQFLRCACRAGGVAERHFGWDSQGLRKLQRRLAMLVVLGVPLLILTPLSDNFGDSQGREALGRLVAMAGLVFLGAALHTILRPGGGAIWPHLDRTHYAWLFRTRHIWYLVGSVFPLSQALAIAIGYSYSAGELLLRWKEMVWLALGVVFAHALVSRGVAVYCRYLVGRRKSDQPKTGDTPVPTAAPGSTTEPADSDQVVAQAVARLQRMLRGAALLGFLVGGIFIWSTTFPALQIVSDVALPPLAKTVTETDSEGTVTTQQVPVTLGDLLLCLVMIAGTVTVARTIPDLLHVSVLHRLGMDRGARYAVALMTRYTLTVFGFVVAFGFVGITWSSLQWLVAAMTVGLGFGLQEIFANFVSGLIILFERPIRIGDVITVNGTTGKVTRMQIRATTITDSDRRELIVPNKKFITDEVINWTLSDSTTRIVIPVGISYDCDPTRASQLLIKLAKAHPLVLRDPEPNSILKGFGNSSLDLELRAFVGSGEVVPQVLHELNIAIERAFREAGIEMPFPQHEIRLRGLTAGLSIEPTGGRPHLPGEKAA